MPKINKKKNELKLKKPKVGVIPKINNTAKNKWIFIALLIVAYGIFFLFLKDKLPFTPDIGNSDAFHLNVSLKYYLWQSIRSGTLPFWTDKLSGGFPLIAESQIGAFFLPHLIIFPLFSNFTHVYILLFTFHLFLISSGMFLLLALFDTPLLLSFLLALTFTWSGLISFRWVHFNFIQVVSLGPLLFWAYFKWNMTGKKRYLLIIIFLTCQMIFGGFMQTTFILMFGLALTHLFVNRPFHLRKSLYLLCALVMGVILAAPQIFPTVQLTRYSFRGLANSYQFAVSIPFNSSDLGGFYSSHALGVPQDLSYINFKTGGNRIYWENTPYLGELFVIAFFIASAYFFLARKRRIVPFSFLMLAFIFLLLSFGGDSPFYFLFGLFPFNMFRTQSRFLLDTVLFMIIASSYMFKSVITRHSFLKVFVYCVLAFNCIILVKTALDYHVYVDSRLLMNSIKPPQGVKFTATYFLLEGNEMWYRNFYSKGWSTKQGRDEFLFLNSAQMPNSNLINGTSVFGVNTGGLSMRRSDYIRTTIAGDLEQLSQNEGTSSSAAHLESLLHLYNISTLITSHPVMLPHFAQAAVKKMGDLALYYWENPAQKNDLFYVPSHIKSLSYLEDIEHEFTSQNVSEDVSFAEALPKDVIQSANLVSINAIRKSDQYLSARMSAPTEQFIAIKKEWYPEWHLFIDGKESPIYKTNLIHMGFYLPKGNHTVELRYIPRSFYFGCMISAVGFLLICLILKKYSSEF